MYLLFLHYCVVQKSVCLYACLPVCLSACLSITSHLIIDVTGLRSRSNHHGWVCPKVCTVQITCIIQRHYHSLQLPGNNIRNGGVNRSTVVAITMLSFPAFSLANHRALNSHNSTIHCPHLGDFLLQLLHDGRSKAHTHTV